MMTLDPDEGSTATPSSEALLRLVEHHGTAQRFGPCTHPVHRIKPNQDGAGAVTVRCRDRRTVMCRSCSALYRLDARHLLTAGLTDEPTKTTAAVGARPRVFVTLTAPSFGKVHMGPTHGRPRRCHPRHGCAAWHLSGDPVIGTALDPSSYDYVGQVLFNAHAGALWAAFTTTARRTLAADAGVSRAQAARRVRVVFAKVVEFQARGVVHLHAVIRLDPVRPPELPAWATTAALRRSVRRAARTARITTPGSASAPAGRLRWGRQCDVRPITAGSGQASVAVVARYIAKYATKAAESAGLDLGPIWCRTCTATGATMLAPGLVRVCRACHGIGRRPEVDLDRLTGHARALVEACWRLGARPEYAQLGLRCHGHQAGYRGHFLTKSRTWSTTFAALRAERHAFAQARRGIGHSPGSVVSGRSIHDHPA